MQNFLINLIRFLCRSYPFVSGQHRASNCTIVKKICCGKGIKLCKLPCGSLIYADLDDSDGRSVFFMGNNDAKVSRIIERVVHEGDTVIDIGANHGEHTITCSQLVGQRGFVHAIEPNPKLAEMILRSLKANNVTNAKIHELALSDKDGKSWFYVNAQISGTGSLEKNNRPKKQRIVVDVRRGDSFFAELRIEKVRLMVIDVEGHEQALLTGAKEFLKDVQPEVILFESLERNTVFWDRSVVKTIKSFGEYVFYEIPKTYMRVRINSINLRKSKTSGHDFLAIHTNCLDELTALLPVSQKY